MGEVPSKPSTRHASQALEAHLQHALLKGRLGRAGGVQLVRYVAECLGYAPVGARGHGRSGAAGELGHDCIALMAAIASCLESYRLAVQR